MSPASGDRAARPGSMILVRHGETEWSRSGQHTGVTDLGLTETGREQARQVAGLLQGRRAGLVLTSPLRRSRETCELAGLGPVAEVDGNLCEWDYGELEGRTTDEIQTERPGWTIWSGDVPGGETPTEVAQRADAVIRRARGVDGDTICFAHGHILRVLAARWIGLPPVAGSLLALGTASISELGWEHSSPVVARWNQQR